MIGYASTTEHDNAERIQRFASLGEFAVGVANDLRSLFAPIDQQALALHAEACGNDAAQARLQNILDTVELARNLVHQILIFSHGSTSERRSISLGKVVREALPLMRAAVANTAMLRIAVDTIAPQVLADPVAIQRVLLNLVLNASRAIRRPHGVIEIGVAGMKSADDRGPRFVRLTVADNGIGMDIATVGDLRQRFMEPPSLSEGAGLGLRTVHQTVCAHGGRLQLDSEPGGGTTVRIDLPALRQLTGLE
jgi:two-component system, cell cycle sensor histidine kinase and response regulator CckA